VHKIVHSVQVAKALVEAGIIEGPLTSIRRIVIDLKPESLPVMYIEYEVDERILEVIPQLGGIEVKHA
jgi:hypothetical protein